MPHRDIEGSHSTLRAVEHDLQVGSMESDFRHLACQRVGTIQCRELEILRPHS
jgi:hypothetical protein